MISASDRENAVLLINEAIASGASCKKACWTVWIVNFNTSHVTVYRKTSVIDAIRYAHFNTSHVTVYLNSIINSKHTCHHFNTSHVTVYLYSSDDECSSKGISIHLMLRFICFGLTIANSLS